MLKEHGFVRCGAIVPKLKVADIEFNVKEIVNQIKIAQENQIQIVCFPELCVTGYTCQDMFYQDILINKAKEGLKQIVDETNNLNIISIVGMPLKFQNQLFNVAVVIQKGKILGIVPKIFISNNQDLDEKRWFVTGKNISKINIEMFGENIPFGTDLLFYDKEKYSMCFGIEIGQDLFAIETPSNNLALNGATIIFNLSATTELISKNEHIKDLIKIQSAKTISAYIYSSAGTGESTSDSVFAGHSMIFENGTCIEQNSGFELNSNIIYTEIDTKKLANNRIKSIDYIENNKEKIYRHIFIDIKDELKQLKRNYSKTPFIPENKKKISQVCNEVLDIQTYALIKRLLHTNMQKTVIGISGGLDSTLAFLSVINAYDILNIPKDNIIAVTMPGFGTTDRTYNNAVELVEIYGATLRKINITKSCMQHFEDIGHNLQIKDATYENAQARERTKILMDIANKENGIVIGTGDLSELALGWCTYNGDHMSMYSLNAGIPKTLIKHIIKHIADNSKEECKKVIYDILDTPISPELLPPDNSGKIKQKTEEQVGPYILHDFFLYHFLKYGAEPQKIYFLACKTFNEEFSSEEIKKWLQIFIKRFFSQQFKRNCMPDGPKVGTISLASRKDWKMPSDAVYNIWLDSIK